MYFNVGMVVNWSSQKITRLMTDATMNANLLAFSKSLLIKNARLISRRASQWGQKVSCFQNREFIKWGFIEF